MLRCYDNTLKIEIKLLYLVRSHWASEIKSETKIHKGSIQSYSGGVWYLPNIVNKLWFQLKYDFICIY